MLRRILHYDQNGTSSEVTVEIEYPKKRGEEFGCRVTITGHTFNLDSTILGIDELQAITLAIQFARSVIMDSDSLKGGNLYWLEPGEGFDPL
jgi:hypothetical protein